MTFSFASRMDNIKGSTIREVLKLTERPEVISFGGGMPAAEFFPIDEIQEVTIKVLREDGQKALQYGPTDGFLPLREKVAGRLQRIGIKNITADNILFTAGSQQGLDFCGKVFLDPGDAIVCERPSYLGAINAFRAYECEFIDIPMDNDGILMDELEEALRTNPKIKFIYVIPDFQNPTGKSWSLERRKQLVELANKYGKVIIEDNPYYELRYSGEPKPAIKSFDTEDRVVFLGTFSKTLAPGLRIGWICAGDEILGKYNLIKQGADLQVNSLTQRQINTYMDMYDMDARIEELIEVYRNRREVMVEQMRKNFPDEIKINIADGGLFLWVEFPEHINTTELMPKVLEKNVAYIPGAPFYPNGGGENTARFSFSAMPEDRIIEGVKRMGEALKELL